MDWHLIVDILSVVITVCGTLLACRRMLADRIQKNSEDIAEIRGILRGAGIIQ